MGVAMLMLLVAVLCNADVGKTANLYRASPVQVVVSVHRASHTAHVSSSCPLAGGGSSSSKQQGSLSRRRRRRRGQARQRHCSELDGSPVHDGRAACWPCRHSLCHQRMVSAQRLCTDGSWRCHGCRQAQHSRRHDAAAIGQLTGWRGSSCRMRVGRGGMAACQVSRCRASE